jgi:hypothetical protein
MGLLDTAKKAIGLGEAKKVEAPKRAPKKSAKEIATEKDEPWVKVIDLDSGAFELDWNQPFIKMLYKAGYRNEVEEDMVDNWFQDVCRQVVMETYEKDEAMVTRSDIGDGKAEYK